MSSQMYLGFKFARTVRLLTCHVLTACSTEKQQLMLWSHTEVLNLPSETHELFKLPVSRAQARRFRTDSSCC